MSARIDGPALILDAVDAARVDRQLRDAIRLAWLTRGLAPPHALLELADQVHALANQVRAAPLVSVLREPAPANMRLSPEALGHKELSAEQAALIMGVSVQHVRRLARQGAVYAARPAGKGAWQIDAASARAWVAGRQETNREAA